MKFKKINALIIPVPACNQCNIGCLEVTLKSRKGTGEQAVPGDGIEKSASAEKERVKTGNESNHQHPTEVVQRRSLVENCLVT